MSKASRFTNYATITAGVLIAGLCGLCTADVLISPGGAMFAPFAAVIGGAPIVFGVWLIVHSVRRLSSGDGR